MILCESWGGSWRNMKAFLDVILMELLLTLPLHGLFTVSQAEWKFQTNFVREILLLSHEFQKDLPWFLKSFSVRSLGVAGSSSVPRFVQQLM